MVQDITVNFIDVVVNNGTEWRLTGFYGESKWENKHKSWNYICEGMQRGANGVPSFVRRRLPYPDGGKPQQDKW